MRRKTGKPPLDRPFVTARTDHGRRLVAHADRAALALGITPGMTITRARGLVPELAVADADVDADLAALHRLARWAGRLYTPIVAPDPPDGLWLDISGCAHRFDGEEPLAKDLQRRLGAAGIAAQIALADTPGCAHAVARHVPAGRPVIIQPGKARNALLLFPVAALRIEPGVAAELDRLGFARIEQLIATPRAPLARRFGPGLFERLDQALGVRPEPISPIVETAIPRCRRTLVEPIMTPEAFARVIDDLVADLVGQLERSGDGARRLDLLFERVDLHVQAISIGTANPSRDPEHLSRLLKQRIETVEPGLGIEAMSLAAPLVEPLAPRQVTGAMTVGRPKTDLTALVDALANRFGRNRLYRTTPRPSAMPEREVARIPPLANGTGARWNEDLPRPSRLIDPPEPIEVTAMLPDHPPAMFIWRSQRHRVARADGPERLHGEWWRSAGDEAETPYAVRDYFEVETVEGGRYWLFRRGDGEHVASGPMTWFLHGAFG